jgi:hypothetical protein
VSVRWIKNWCWEVLCLAAYLALAGCQLFVHPVVGLADNGDFPKVLAQYGICNPNPETGVLKYVRAKYIIHDRCYWDSPLTSSETLFVQLIRHVAIWSGRASFSITAAGKAHLAVMLASLAILLWALHASRAVFRFLIPPFAILIFSDVLYVSYLNSFYMDAASMVFLLLTSALATAGILRPRTWVALAFGVSGVLLALSKTQHVFTSFLFAVLAGWLAVRAFRGKGRRLGTTIQQAAAWTVSAVAILAGTVATLELAPKDYKAEPFYSVIFYNLIPASEDHAAALAELGLPPADLPLVGTHAYSLDSPVTQPAWRTDFIGRIGYRTILMYYFRHPGIALRLVNQGLSYFAAAMRPGNIANYQREDGFPPATLAQHFAFWSHWRAWILWVLPMHIVFFWCVMGTGALCCLGKRRWADRWPLYPLVLVLAASGMVEFFLAVLLDATETSRHLFFFHVITELLILSALAALLSLIKLHKDKGLLL